MEIFYQIYISKATISTKNLENRIFLSLWNSLMAKVAIELFPDLYQLFADLCQLIADLCQLFADLCQLFADLCPRWFFKQGYNFFKVRTF